MEIRLREKLAKDAADRVKRHVRRTCFLVCVFMAVGSETADAQFDSLVGRFSLHVNGGFQSSVAAFKAVLPFTAYGEDGRFQTNHRIGNGAIIEAGASVQSWQQLSQLSLGATFTVAKTSDVATLTGSVPHPFLVNDFRTVASKSLRFEHHERAIHLHVGWVVPIPNYEHLDITIFGGPSLFKVTRETLSDVSVLETGLPFSDVVVNTGKREYSNSGWGGHVGTDITYMLTNTVGVGGFVRFGTGSIDVPITGAIESINVGGVQTGAGIRIRY